MQSHPELIRLVLERADLLRAIHPSGVLDEDLLQRVSSATITQLGATSERTNTAPSELVRGGLLYALDALDPAHSIFQDDPSPLGSYWHGMLHRREGDFDNARYWFRRAGTPPCFRDNSAEGKQGDPLQLTRIFETNPTGTALQEALQLLRAEFETLLTYCCQLSRTA